MKFTTPTLSDNVAFFRLEGDESHRGMTIGMVVGETKNEASFHVRYQHVTEAHTLVGSTGYEAQHPLIITMIIMMSKITAYQKQKARNLNTKRANLRTIRREIKIVVETELR
jgi:hypothetical protein